MENKVAFNAGQQGPSIANILILETFCSQCKSNRTHAKFKDAKSEFGQIRKTTGSLQAKILIHAQNAACARMLRTKLKDAESAI